MSQRFVSLIGATVLIPLLAACGGAPAATPLVSQKVMATAPLVLATAPPQAKATAPQAKATAPLPAATPMAAAAPPMVAAAPPLNGMNAPAVAPPAAEVLATAPAQDQSIASPAPVEPVVENPFTQTSQDHLSTFAMDVDTASYSMARNYLRNGALPPAESVRIEEFVNAFDYHYASPSQDAFGIAVEAAPSPFADTTKLVRIGIQGRRVDAGQRQDVALTFVVDASGSMSAENRLPLVKESLKLLVSQLRPTDQVAIVVFGTTSYVKLEPTTGDQQSVILKAIDSLENDGSTNMDDGMWMGYALAGKQFKQGASNRVIVLSDGQANTGATNPDEILQRVSDFKAQGIYLNTVGFGMGGYNDTMLERLADAGNGNYSYIDTIAEARTLFVQKLTGTFEVVAKDAKIQVDFNPAVVGSYRLLGYENRAVADADFRNDTVDAGEVGAGHQVTALYEVVLTGQGSGNALTVQVRYADPKTGAVHELQQPFADSAIRSDFLATTPEFRLAVAVAGFAEHLRGGSYAQSRPLKAILAIAEQVAPQLANDATSQELVELITLAQQLGG